MNVRRLFVPLILGVSLMLVLLCSLSDQPSVAAQEQRSALQSSDVITVCLSGECDYTSVQSAVDAASEGSVIKVATGVYADVHVRSRKDIIQNGVVTQVVYISKTVTVRGGYTATDWTEPDPDANPTTLDAQGQGRVLYITGDISPTVEGLHITGGDANGLGGAFVGNPDAGGGVYVISATITLNENDIYGNTAGSGGGVALLESEGEGITLSGNDIHNNTASWIGGVMLLYSDNATLSGNSIYSNTSDFGMGGGVYVGGGKNVTLSGNEIWNNDSGLVNGMFGGGGVYVDSSYNVTLSGNEIYVNTAGSGPYIGWGSYGGGIALYNSNNATLSGNRIWGNMADDKPGGGVALHESDNATLSGNRITSNNTTVNKPGGGVYIKKSDGVALSGNEIYANEAYEGGGVYVEGSDNATLDNNVIADNRAEANGSGLYVAESTVRLRHDTLATNTSSDGSIPLTTGGSGIHVALTSTVAMTNTILVSHTVGVTVAEDSTATLEATLWGTDTWANESDWGGAGVIVTGTLNYWGIPDFVFLPQWDYHISESSAAIDKGVDAGLEIDMDGEPRDLTPDLGADEFRIRTCWARVNDDSTDYFAVQPAVDAASPGDLVKVAGVCVGAVKGEWWLRQQVYLDKSLTIRGGYTTTNWITPNLETNPTTLDAQGQGRVVYITGGANPTIEGLRITGGDATGLGGGGGNSGGGIYITNAQATISNSQIISNTGYSYGGGLYLSNSNTKLINNIIADNTARVSGGGLHLGGSDNASLSGNAIYSNTAGWGGGVRLEGSANVTLSGNVIHNNMADVGSGVFVDFSDSATLSSNVIHNNETDGDGGGIVVYECVDAVLDNNVIADNQAGGDGSGLYVTASTAEISHNTIARNTSSAGSGFHVTNEAGAYSTVSLTDTILVSHTVGIVVAEGSTATLEATLWGTDTWANESDWDGAGTIITGTHNYWGAPGFVDPDAGDYHLSPSSAAIDKGVESGMNYDIDGDPRPMGHSYDLGADELRIALNVIKQAHPDPVQAGAQLTYTLRVTNTGDLTLTATITDVLPAQVTSSGNSTWIPDPITPGGIWAETFVVTVEMDYAGPLMNVVQVTTEEGATGIYTETSLSLAPLLAVTKRACPDPVRAGEQLTYTLHVTNTGNVPLTATITDKLPAHVTPGGLLTWTTTLPAPGSVWTETLVVTVEMGYAGPLTNVVQVATAEGASGTYTEVTTVPVPNQAPYAPSHPTPADGATGVPITQTLSWQGGDPNGDPVTYTVAISGVIDTTTLTSYAPSLITDTAYSWRITATDGLSVSVGATWRFTTTAAPTESFEVYLPVVLRKH